jgi:hypothetical protein
MDIVYHKLKEPQLEVTDGGMKMLLLRCALLDTHRNKNSMQLFPELEQINQRMGGLYEQKRQQYE